MFWTAKDRIFSRRKLCTFGICICVQQRWCCTWVSNFVLCSQLTETCKNDPLGRRPAKTEQPAAEIEAEIEAEPSAERRADTGEENMRSQHRLCGLGLADLWKIWAEEGAGVHFRWTDSQSSVLFGVREVVQNVGFWDTAAMEDNECGALVMISSSDGQLEFRRLRGFRNKIIILIYSFVQQYLSQTPSNRPRFGEKSLDLVKESKLHKKQRQKNWNNKRKKSKQKKTNWNKQHDSTTNDTQHDKTLMTDLLSWDFQQLVWVP